MTEFREQARTQTRIIVIETNPTRNSSKSSLPKHSPVSILPILIHDPTIESLKPEILYLE